VGMELLLARLHTWQEHVASDREGTSFAPEIPSISGIVARWRRLQSTSWNQVIEAALEAERERVAESWHHLFGLISRSADPETAARVMPVAEEFLQSATLAQFGARLELLAIFRDHCAIVGGDLRRLAICLANLASYYSQHLTSVEAELRALLAPIRKELAVCTSGWMLFWYLFVCFTQASHQAHSICLLDDLHRLVSRHDCSPML
jgi:midasin (ATPase involved in ribosome maturation)